MGGKNGLGLLCVASGDGSLLVLDVPLPSKEWGAERKVLDLRPTVSLAVDDNPPPLTGYATSCRWSPAPVDGEHGFVAFGCSSGEIFVQPILATRGADATLPDADSAVILKAEDRVGVMSIDFCGDRGEFIVVGAFCLGCELMLVIWRLVPGASTFVEEGKGFVVRGVLWKWSRE